jgi:hypothetical protein
VEVAIPGYLPAVHSTASSKLDFDSIENSHSCNFDITADLHLLVPEAHLLSPI